MRCFLALIAVLSLAFAPAPFPKAADAIELRRLQGTWDLVAEADGGKPRPLQKLRAVFSGSNLNLTDDKGAYRWKFTIDPKASPKAMDQRLPAEEKGKYLLLKAAYSLDGDTLKICYDAGDWWARPKDLSGKGANHHLRIFKRMKR